MHLTRVPHRYAAPCLPGQGERFDAPGAASTRDGCPRPSTGGEPTHKPGRLMAAGDGYGRPADDARQVTGMPAERRGNLPRPPSPENGAAGTVHLPRLCFGGAERIDVRQTGGIAARTRQDRALIRGEAA